MVLYGYLPAPQRQSRDAANPGTTQPDKLGECALRFVVLFVQLTNIINGKSANTKMWSPKCAHVETQRTAASYTVCTVALSELPSPLARRRAGHLTTKRQILYFHTHKTDQFKRRAGDTLHCTTNCSQMHSLTHKSLPHDALNKPNLLPKYLAIWLHRTQGMAVVGRSVGAFF